MYCFVQYMVLFDHYFRRFKIFTSLSLQQICSSSRMWGSSCYSHVANNCMPASVHEE